jgi:hypothetical protein
VLLPWLAVLGLLALPSNRTARAWWIWVPLIVLALLASGLAAATDAADNEGLSFSVQATGAAAFGLAAIWLLGAGLARRCRAVSIVLMALAFAAGSVLAFVVSPVWEQLSELRRYAPAILLYVLLFWVASGVVFAGALNLTGRMCRKRFGRLRVALWLPLWIWVMWIVVGGLIGGVETFVAGGSFEWGEMLVGPIVLSLVCYAVILPFLILSFTSSFYRERLQGLLRLPTTEASPPAPTPSPVAEPGSPR